MPIEFGFVNIFSFTRLIQLYKVVSPLNIVGLNTRGLSQIHVDKSKV